MGVYFPIQRGAGGKFIFKYLFFFLIDAVKGQLPVCKTKHVEGGGGGGGGSTSSVCQLLLPASTLLPLREAPL